MELKDLFIKYGCDKESRHKYSQYYKTLFDRYSDSGKLLEIGVFDGASMLAWDKYLTSDWSIVGIDTNLAQVPSKTRDKLSEMVVLHQMNAYDQATLDFLKNQYGLFDIIIDDGSHLLQDLDAIDKYKKLLKPSGTLVIEDCCAYYSTFDLEKFVRGKDYQIIDFRLNEGASNDSIILEFINL